VTMTFYTVAGRVEVPRDVVEEIVTTELSNRFYWRHGGHLERREVAAFLEGRCGWLVVRRVARYILLHAENLVLSNYLLHIASLGWHEASGYLRFNMPLLKRLRKLYRRVEEEFGRSRKCLRIAKEMISECMKYGIDPL